MLVNGVDIVEVPRIKRISEQYGSRFLHRIYTPLEISYCKGRAQQLASRFAGKEAMMKALGTGIRGIPWKDIEIIRLKGKPPTIQLHRKAAKRAQDLHFQHCVIIVALKRICNSIYSLRKLKFQYPANH